ncbi:hypothetical protein [Saccharothrix sp.]|uniref:hypothetical protein n=1 Tax=Saccharothrix sp. TaxID=1873460 RepID=UPI0028124D5B|nr:hypothetical protein [Saccharothrix sp.]
MRVSDSRCWNSPIREGWWPRRGETGPTQEDVSASGATLLPDLPAPSAPVQTLVPPSKLGDEPTGPAAAPAQVHVDCEEDRTTVFGRLPADVASPADIPSTATGASVHDLFHPELEATAAHPTLPAVFGQAVGSDQRSATYDEPTEELSVVNQLTGTNNPLLADPDEVDPEEVQRYLARVLDSLRGM